MRFVIVLVLALFVGSCSDPEPMQTPGAGNGGASSGQASDGTSGDSSAAGIGGGGEAGDGLLGTGGTAGAAGGDIGSGGQGGDTEPGVPVPSEIDLSNLIPTSGRHVLLNGIVGDDIFTAHLIALDLDGNEAHDLTPADETLSIWATSADGRTTLMSGGYAFGPAPIRYVMHLLDSGIVPPTPIAGFGQPMRGGSFDGFTRDGRFAITARDDTDRRDGIEIIDTWKAKLHTSIDSDTDGDLTYAAVAPDGYWFWYYFQTPDARPVKLARITDEGVEQLDIPDFSGGDFSPDGKRIVYLDDSGVGAPFYRDLDSDSSVAVIPDPVPGLTLESLSLSQYVGDNDHMFAYFNTGTDQKLTLRRLTLSSGESNAITELGHAGLIASGFADNTAVIALYQDGLEYTVAIEDPLGIAPHQEVTTIPMGDPATLYVGPLGARHAYYMADGIGLTLIALDEDGAVQKATLIDPSTEQGFLCNFNQSVPRGNRLAFIYDGDTKTALIDLSAPLARRALDVEAQHEGALSCPVTSNDGTLIAYAERVNTDGAKHTWIYVVRWPEADDPEAPALVYETDGTLEVMLTGP